MLENFFGSAILIRATSSARLVFYRQAQRSFLFFLLLNVFGVAQLLARPADVAQGQMTAARLNNLGVALMNQQLTDKAIQRFDQAHQADPSLAIPMMNKGIALLYLQKLPEAEAALAQAGRQDPKNPRIWYSMALVHRNAGKPALAVKDLQKVLALEPGDADAHYFLGSSYLELQQRDQAVKEFQEALRLNPLHASAMFGLGRALQGEGKIDEARADLKRFEQITSQKIASPLTTTYGEQGHNAKVEDIMVPEPAVAPMIPIHFAVQPIAGTAPSSKAPGAGAMGGGACVLDIVSPWHKDLISLDSGDHAIRAYENVGGGNFRELSEQQTGLSAHGEGIACAVGDYDNDGLPDLAVALADRVLLFHNLGHGKFADVTEQVGIVQKNHPGGLTFIDFDHDGDLDLYVTGSASSTVASGGSVMWRNNGNGSFTEWTEPTGLAGTGSTVGAVLSDLNNDRAVDLVVANATGAPNFYLNPREGKFKAAPVYENADFAPASGVTIADFNKDGWMDIALTHAGAPGVTVWRNVEGKSFARLPLPAIDTKRAWGVTAIDVDNDGWIDLAAVVETDHGSALRVFRNEGAQGFADVTKDLGLDQIALEDARSVLAVDVDNDGAPDLIVTQRHAPPVILRNIGGNRNHSLRIDLTGLADNKTGLGTKVEVFAGGLWQKFEVAGASGYLSQGSNEILAGLGQQSQVDIVRMLWPTGVPQDEIDLPTTAKVSFTELDRRGSSCPVLFAWNGRHYEFVSDVIGAAVVGHWVSPTATNQADADEWIKVSGSQLKARHGLLSLRFGEPMEEINFVDQVRLVAVDHPEDTQVFPDEKFLSEPPFASGATVVTGAAHPPRGAWDNQGRDVLALLSKQDHEYVQDFTVLHYAGYTKMHTLTLDLGPWTPDNPLRLLMHGYIEYFSASSMYAAWQAGLHPIPPYVEAQMPDGSWKRIIDDMGFPAGLPRTIVVDLTGKLPQGTQRIRLTTNLQIYWDQVLIDNGTQASARIRQTELPLATAHLAFRGYPQQVEGKAPGDLTYHYDRISATGPFAWQRGSYTNYGDVTPLLKKVDDKDVIFGSGEEIDAEFDAASLPALSPHWKRDYFFYANGFVKDMDFYEASPFTVGQMPFHAMSRYPYAASEHYPDDPSSVEYRLNWNDRFESGDRLQRFQFDYRPAKSLPITGQP